MSATLIATKPAPLLNTPDFQKTFGSSTLPLCDKGLLRPVEMIALPGTKFQVIRYINSLVAEVKTNDYSSAVYVDLRFVCHASELAPDRVRKLPPKDVVLKRLENALGLPYIWGGNWEKGIPEIREYYKADIPKEFEKVWTLAGVDCSGLLYEATNGFTPRNTSELYTFGQQVTSREDLLPLDILVWPGHVIIVFNSSTVIESLHPKGVILTPLHERLASIADKKFSIRRFYA